MSFINLFKKIKKPHNDQNHDDVYVNHLKEIDKEVELDHPIVETYNANTVENEDSHTDDRHLFINDSVTNSVENFVNGDFNEIYIESITLKSSINDFDGTKQAAEPTDNDLINRINKLECFEYGIISPDKVIGISQGEIRQLPPSLFSNVQEQKKYGLSSEIIFGSKEEIAAKCRGRIKDNIFICKDCLQCYLDWIGHIKLASPVSNIWFTKNHSYHYGYEFGYGSSITEMLVDMPIRKVLSLEKYVVTNPKDTDLKYKQMLDIDEYRKAISNYGYNFRAKTGAEAIYELLVHIDIDCIVDELNREFGSCIEIEKRKRIEQRIQIINSFKKKHFNLEWVMLEYIPVISPELRRKWHTENKERYITFNLDELYLKVLFCNTKLKEKMDYAPNIVIDSYKRDLQLAVDRLFDNLSNIIDIKYHHSWLFKRS